MFIVERTDKRYTNHVLKVNQAISHVDIMYTLIT